VHLAVLFYGDVAEVARIAAANPGIDPDALAIGQLLRIPVDLLLPASVAP
jgi:nucleoid-associated protein YgaU